MSHRFVTFRTNISSQSGLTLVELMIAMVLGLLLLGGVVSVYISGKQSNTARDGWSLLQENGRAAIRMLESGIASAGYPRSEDTIPLVVIDGDVTGWSKSFLTADGTPGDRITVSFNPRGECGPGEYFSCDCLGQATKLASVVNSYYLEAGQLMCRGSSGGAQPLVENIDAFQVRYGVDTDGDGAVDGAYLPATDLAADDWAQVIAVQIGLVVNSAMPVRDVPEDSPPLAVLDFEYTAPTGPIDGRLARRVFTTTIPLRNRADLCDGC
ncbi:MAG: PilW family protein [Thiotrichales bacterium]